MDNETQLEILNGKSEIFNEEPVVEDKENDEPEERPLRFDQDPKVRRYVERQIEKALKERIPEHSAEREFKRDIQEDKKINLPPSFVRLIGNDTPEKVQVLNDLSDYFGTLKGEARNEFLEELKQQEAVARQQDMEALNELQNGFEQIEEEYGVDLESKPQLRTSFVEYLRKVSHKNADGEVDQFADIPSAWEEFQERQRRSQGPNRAKELASKGLARSSDASTNDGPKQKDWKSVERYFEQLKKSS